jgi:chromosome segregation ATPase
MAREAIFSRETRLWHPASGWQTFPAGESNPGPAWSEVEGGGAEGTKTQASTLEELAAVTKRAERAEEAAAAREHDLSRLAQERDDAVAGRAAITRRAEEAEKALGEAEADKARYAEERDAARGLETELRAEIGRLKAAKAEDTATIERIVGELNQANALYAAEKARADAAEAEVAKMDGDGDKKIGGSKRKAADKPE